MSFTPINFVHSLKYMGIGMLGVFIIVGIIIASTYAIGSITDAMAKRAESNGTEGDANG